jgi:prepilin-type N-terminal cleavage/methylation domain-containing protein
MNIRQPKSRRRGFTLIEAMFASVVLTIGVLGLSGTLAASYQQTIAMRQNATAVALGRQLLDEIAALPDNTAPSTGTAPAVRTSFTSVGQYNGYTDTSTDLPMLGPSSNSTVDATGSVAYTRQVTVQSSGPGFPGGGITDTSSPNTDFALVTVTVTAPDGQSVSLSRVVCNYAFTR